MQTATMDALDAMLQEIDAGAEPVKKNSKKAPVPCLRIETLAKLCHDLPRKIAALHDLKTEVDGDKKDIIDAAKPLQYDASKRAGFHIGTIQINGVNIQCRKFHHTKKIVDKQRIHMIAKLWADRFQKHWNVQRMIVETPEVIAALNAAGVKYFCAITPTSALHEEMSWNDEVRGMMASACPDVLPIWAVACGKDA